MTTLPPAAVVTDIEGTTTPIGFVRDELFPYARSRLPEFVRTRADDPEVAPILADIRRLAPDHEPTEILLHWMDQDAKVTPLKALQGLIWRQGYADGTLRGALYPDVAPCLRRWATAGLRLFVYSSGSVDAQRLLFGHSVAGDLTDLFAGFFDTRIGGKREPDSYARLAIGLNLPAFEMVFLSDVVDELDAAGAAGWRTCQIIRPTDGTIAGEEHPTAPDFEAAARAIGLP